jgi:hypothetical protein
MTRAEVRAVLEKAGAEINPKQSTEDSWVLEWGMELFFEENASDPEKAALRQIAVEDEHYFWEGEQVLQRPLHVALRAMSDVASAASWRPEDAAVDPDGNGPLPSPGSVTDEDLFSEGTLWLPAARLGLVMTSGTVSDLVWRRDKDMPREFLGRVTPEQMELSRRPDLEDVLHQSWRSRAGPPDLPTPRRNVLETALALAFVLVMTVIAWKGWQEMRLWQQAATLQGTLVKIEPLADPKRSPVYHIEYKDLTGRMQQVKLERADFYIAPTGSGDTVSLAYADTDPPRVKGVARAKDSAFLTYFPWAVGVALGYVILKLVVGSLSSRKRNRGSGLPMLMS